MRKIIAPVAAAVAVAVVAVLAYAATRPDSFRVERSLRMQAAPERVFALVSNLEQFNRWNPWLKKDPATQGQYSAAVSGPGASYAWQSREVGSGSMTIVESAAPGRMTMRLDFVKPFEAHNMAEFSITPDGDGSRVTWAMYGPANFVTKLMQVAFSMDKMIGPDFEQGLAGLKALAEAN